MKGRPCHLSAARGRTGSAAGWRWVGGACWAAIKSRELASFVYWYTKARKSVLRPAAGPNLSLDQVWISSRPHDGCWPIFSLLLLRFLVENSHSAVRKPVQKKKVLNGSGQTKRFELDLEVARTHFEDSKTSV